MIISFLYTQLLTKVDSWRDSANTEQAQLALAAPRISDTLRRMIEISLKHASELTVTNTVTAIHLGSFYYTFLNLSYKITSHGN